MIHNTQQFVSYPSSYRDFIIIELLTWLTTASNSGDVVMGGFEEERSSSLSSEGPHLT